MSDEVYALGFGLVVGAFACVITWGTTSSAWKRDAVRAGAAEYVVTDKESGAVEFRWKQNKGD